MSDPKTVSMSDYAFVLGVAMGSLIKDPEQKALLYGLLRLPSSQQLAEESPGTLIAAMVEEALLEKERRT